VRQWVHAEVRECVHLLGNTIPIFMSTWGHLTYLYKRVATSIWEQHSYLYVYLGTPHLSLQTRSYIYLGTTFLSLCLPGDTSLIFTNS